jgi:SAM-dependent methyltransferase
MSAPVHAASPDYSVARFLDDPDFLSGVVRFDLPRLGDIRGLRGIHLQCHLGTDTLSLHRLGAQMSGLDFSAPALEEARALAARTGAEIEYVQADVYDALDVLEAGAFDFVYTGIGAICWLPSIELWADVVAGLLAPGGRLFIRDGHPMLGALADARPDRLLAVEYPYFEQRTPLIWTGGGTYVATDAEFEHTTTHEWNHGIGEIVTALLTRGMELTGLVEHDSVPWDALPGQMELSPTGEYRLIDRPERLAASYTLQAIRSDG